MPHLTFRGFTDSQVQKASEILIPDLARLLDCPEDYFMFDNLSVNSFYKGQKTVTFPFITIAWFERGKTQRDAMAQVITKAMHELGVPELEIGYTVLAEDSYYINGKPVLTDCSKGKPSTAQSHVQEAL